MQKITIGDFIIRIEHYSEIGRLQIMVTDSKNGHVIGAVTAICTHEWRPATKVDSPISLN